MIAYVDSSILARAYLSDEDGHAEAVQLLDDPEIAVVTAAWTHVEVTSALVRAAHHARRRPQRLLAVLDSDLGDGGRVTLLRGSQDVLELRSRQLVTQHRVRALDAYHLAFAENYVERLAEPGEAVVFVSRDVAQAKAARAIGLTVA